MTVWFVHAMFRGTVFNPLTIFSFWAFLTLSRFIVVFKIKFSAFKIKFVAPNKIKLLLVLLLLFFNVSVVIF
uniref:Uncharacterized protein n=1 Tax=Ixodes ricinus TaxID=34613 RepID=A0A6B0UA38_IXORI